MCAPDGRTVVCDTGPPSLATAGTGDVLTGTVGTFLAKGLAARAVPHQAGLVASDVVAALPAILDP